ncbi:lipoyl(octanoyl) transferase LipB [Caballeronia concitans]|uniref:Octanoyltransferase n=1 Tax=Caballeronia concitans TaxID=1777133 RepID=A0A658QR15_9BURK|nr:lipoyl(octanoyl) transferase LipB [Caballeronia concitans]SAL12566.1 lipoate-protein ligase B [Caballeronia concitans]
MSATPLAVPQEIDDAPDTVLDAGEFPVALRWRGLEPYAQSFDAMRAFTDARTPETPDEIWLVEHPQVFTLGLAGDPAHLLLADSGIPLVKVDRGGQITYHGPGQIVAYLLLDLRRRKLMVRELVRRIEEAVIETLATYNLATDRKAGAPGIYVAQPSADAARQGANVRLHELHRGAKIAALGLKIRNGCSYHGVSLNVKMDLRPFLAINPCGYAGLETVDMATLGAAADWRDVALTLAERLAHQIDGSQGAAAQPQDGASRLAASTGSTE